MALLDNVRADLGISTTDEDTRINIAIFSAEQRLKMIGVENIVESDPLTQQAIMLYCRYWFNYQGDAEKAYETFLSVASGMALSTEYGESYE